MTDFKTVEIAEMALDVVRHLEPSDADISIKIAALRSAADTLQQSVLVRALTASLANLLLAPK